MQTQSQHIAVFTEAIHYVFLRWTALQIVIEQSLGGHKTLQSVSLLGEYIVDFFTQYGSRIDADDLEDNITAFFEESFNVELEDGSAAQISQLLCLLFNSISEGNLEHFERVKTLASAKTSALQQSRRELVRGADDEDVDDDDDCDDSDDDDDVMEDADAQKDKGVPLREYLLSMEGSGHESKATVDDDGFEVVGAGKGKGRRR
ncbi:hypothetical protein HDU84_006653 [Entophlyctis sp. JEL0112]|nr:hypothetical protein HDU84_006653 [Entophlyctis sp. JEL0112]